MTAAPIVANLATGQGADTLPGIENLIRSPGNDTLIGDGKANVLKGGRGAATAAATSSS